MGDAEELKAILMEAFGDSSSDSDGESSRDRERLVQVKDSSGEVARPLSIFGDSDVWAPIAGINGLWICKDFCLQINSIPCFQLLRKAMRFGDLPPWAVELSHIIRENVLFSSYFSESMDLTNENSKETHLFPSELLWREPLFNQFIVNIYQPGEGICAHVDLMRFEDGIAIISLESSCIMHFSSVGTEANHLAEANRDCIPSSKIPVLLTPGSVVLMWGEARYLWKHEINRKQGLQIWDGKEIEQKRRTSITLRRLCQTD